MYLLSDNLRATTSYIKMNDVTNIYMNQKKSKYLE